MTLSENALYTVDGWRVFFEHLKPGGLITFSRWYFNANKYETYRLFAVAWAMLLSEGVADPGSHMALIHTDQVATLLTSRTPFSEQDLNALREKVRDKQFAFLYLPGEPAATEELRGIVAARTLDDLNPGGTIRPDRLLSGVRLGSLLF